MTEITNLNLEGANELEAGNTDRQASVIIPVIEEQVIIDKKIIDKAKIIVSKSVSENEESVTVPVEHDEVRVERIPINKYIQEMPQALRYEGDTMVIPVLQEVVVTEKRLLLVEEVRITKMKVQTEETKHVTLRKEDVNVTRTEIERT